MLRLNDLLAQSGLEPAECTVTLHTPTEHRFARMIGYIHQQRREIFETFHSSHSKPAERTLKRRPFTVAFIAQEDRSLLLAGVYQVRGCRYREASEVGCDPLVREMVDQYGVDEPYGGKGGMWFDMEPTGILKDLEGRLRIAPKLSQVYVRLAETLDAQIVEIARENRFNRPLPGWRELALSGPEVRALGPAARARLREWRGVYLIVDESDGQRYVGSAYGEENLWGRWSKHVARDRGVTKELRRRDPSQFQFSILERVSPDMAADEVIALEYSWMNRLHTRQFGLNA